MMVTGRFGIVTSDFGKEERNRSRESRHVIAILGTA
jgi:hypothetical protein